MITSYNIEPRTRKYVKRYGFLSFERNLSNKYGRQLLDTTKTGTDVVKTKKVAHKAAEATVEFIGNKITDEIVKTKAVPDENERNVKEIIIPPEQREEILKDLSIVKMEHYKIIKSFGCIKVCDK